MRYLKFLYIPLLTMLSVAVMATEPTNIIVEVEGKSYYKHLVVSGDTIYSLSKAYSVSESSIMECNDGLTPSTLQLDSYVLIPKGEVASIEAQPKVDKKRYIYHSVKQGETIYAIARKYKVSVTVLESDNPDVDIEHIYPDMEIKVRRSERGFATVDEIEREREKRASVEDAKIIEERKTEEVATETLIENVVTETPAEEMVTEEIAVDVVAEESTAADTLRREFRRLAPYQILRTSLMMPFHKDGKVNTSIVDFYRGVLLAMEDLKTEGYDIELSVFDTECSEERIQAIMADEPLLYEAQLIIGPVYENELSVVLPYATTNNIPVVSPLADIASLQSPVLFQMQAENYNKYDKFARLFDGSREVVVIHTASIDRDYEAKMREFSAGHVVYELNYAFDRESLLYLRNADGTNGEQIDITEFMRSRTEKLFVVLASKETDVDRVLTTLSSTRASILGRGGLMGDYVVVGNRRWKQMTSIDKQTFFNNNTIFLVPYHANRANESIALFDARYVQAYEVLPTMYSYRGYDAAMIFCCRMFEGFDEDTNEVLMPLATPYIFDFVEGLYVNTCWTMERYKSNYTIEVE